jgi:hypothetical protein
VIRAALLYGPEGRVRRRVYKRKFDWDEAARLRALGLSYRAIGNRLGVSDSAVEYALKPERRARLAVTGRRWIMSGVCPDCGKQGTTRPEYGQGSGRCRDCANRAMAHGDDTHAKCFCCKRWLPHSEFTKGSQRKSLGGLHSFCRECQTAAKRDWRHRNLERQRAYDRAYKAKRRAAAKQAEQEAA